MISKHMIITSAFVLALASTTQLYAEEGKQKGVLQLNANANIDTRFDGGPRPSKEKMTKHIITGTAGTVTAINGDVLTVQGKNDVVYTVTTANADIRHENNTDARVGDISVGDTVVVQGTLENTSIEAKTILAFDYNLEKAHEMKKEMRVEGKAEGKIGFFHRIGLFFKGIFRKH